MTLRVLFMDRGRADTVHARNFAPGTRAQSLDEAARIAAAKQASEVAYRRPSWR